MKPKKKMHDLLSRTLINTLSFLAVLFFIFFAPIPAFSPFFTAAIGAVASVALWEYFKLCQKKELHPAIKIGIITALLYVFAVYFKYGFYFPFFELLPEIVLGLSFFACFVYFWIWGKDILINISSTFFGILYIVIPLSCFVRIAYLFLEENPFEGSVWLLYLIAVTKISDMGGYFFGKWFGKTKISPRVSPNKTVAGAIGGLILSIVLSLIFVAVGRNFGFFETFHYALAAILGALLAIFGQLGDLAESLLKRDCEVKDSNTLPGVGGVLDMVDSLLFTAPLLFIFLKLGLP